MATTNSKKQTSKEKLSKQWEQIISEQLVGKKIVQVRWMTKKEADANYWDYQPVLLILDDGSILCPMSDDEGNNAGSLIHLGGKQERIIPVMRL